jgi:hypothetical protein
LDTRLDSLELQSYDSAMGTTDSFQGTEAPVVPDPQADAEWARIRKVGHGIRLAQVGAGLIAWIGCVLVEYDIRPNTSTLYRLKWHQVPEAQMFVVVAVLISVYALARHLRAIVTLYYFCAPKVQDVEVSGRYGQKLDMAMQPVRIFGDFLATLMSGGAVVIMSQRCLDDRPAIGFESLPAGRNLYHNMCEHESPEIWVIICIMAGACTLFFISMVIEWNKWAQFNAIRERVFESELLAAITDPRNNQSRPASRMEIHRQGTMGHFQTSSRNQALISSVCRALELIVSVFIVYILAITDLDLDTTGLPPIATDYQNLEAQKNAFYRYPEFQGVFGLASFGLIYSIATMLLKLHNKLIGRHNRRDRNSIENLTRIFRFVFDLIMVFVCLLSGILALLRCYRQANSEVVRSYDLCEDTPEWIYAAGALILLAAIYALSSAVSWTRYLKGRNRLFDYRTERLQAQCQAILASARNEEVFDGGDEMKYVGIDAIPGLEVLPAARASYFHNKRWVLPYAFRFVEGLCALSTCLLLWTSDIRFQRDYGNIPNAQFDFPFQTFLEFGLLFGINVLVLLYAIAWFALRFYWFSPCNIQACRCLRYGPKRSTVATLAPFEFLVNVILLAVTVGAAIAGVTRCWETLPRLGEYRLCQEEDASKEYRYAIGATFACTFALIISTLYSLFAWKFLRSYEEIAIYKNAAIVYKRLLNRDRSRPATMQNQSIEHPYVAQHQRDSDDDDGDDDGANDSDASDSNNNRTGIVTVVTDED